jgi:hypothetical protein
MDYKASTDLTVRIVTIAVTILFAGIVGRMAMIIRSSAADDPKMSYILYAGIGFVFLIYFVSFGLCTWSYRVDEKSLIIIAPFYKKTINKQDISHASLIEKDNLGSVIRTGGIGGLFGYYGWFRGSKVGSFFMYATQMKNLILIETKDGKKYIITPDDVSMVSAIEPFSDHFRP